MSDETAQGQEPSAQPATGQAPVASAPVKAQEAPKVFDEQYVTELRSEAAGYRKQLREVQATLKELQEKEGDSQATAAKLAGLEAQLAEAAAKADVAQKQAQLVRLAVKAGVDPDVASLLDLSKIDLSNEKAALETLSKLAGPRGNQVRPGGVAGTSDAELRAAMFGPRPSKLFGG